ncbi:MAG: DUF3445 domain-containing protein [Paracoccaceae bacterium]
MRPDTAAPINRPLDPAPWQRPRFNAIPGTEAVDAGDWLQVSDTYAGQMRERLRLMAHRPDAVIGRTDGSDPAIAELFAHTLERLRRHPAYVVGTDQVTCPDGREVRLGDPLTTLTQLVQEDICVMERRGDEYVLTAATLCFPSGWTLAEKLGRPMTRIHRPVTTYDATAAKRVGRLFEGLQVARPILRWNGNFKAEARLFAPETEADHHRPRPPQEPLYYRSERQCLLRLPQTRAIIFSIHTYNWRLADLPIPPPAPEA